MLMLLLEIMTVYRTMALFSSSITSVSVKQNNTQKISAQQRQLIPKYLQASKRQKNLYAALKNVKLGIYIGHIIRVKKYQMILALIIEGKICNRQKKKFMAEDSQP